MERKIRRTLLALAAVFAAFQATGVAPAAAEEKTEIVTLDTRPGVTLDFLLIEAAKPIASVVLLEGSGGDLNLSGTKARLGGFLSTSRNLFAARGFVVALVDAPSDKKGDGGMPGGFRSGAAHVTDIDAVVAWMTHKYGLPVWLIGVSRGTQSAAYVAIHGQAGIGGLVLASSMARVKDKSTPVPSMDLDRIAVPTLVVAHENDGCKFTPPKGAEEIKRGLTKAAAVELLYFTGGRDAGKDPCRSSSYHTFYGIEEEVVAVIADFIKAKTVALEQQ